MSEQPPPPPRPGGGGLSLYADLLDPPADSSASISRAPVVSHEALSAVKDQEAAAAASKKPTVNPALHFQPIRRPQQKTAQKPKVGFPKAPPAGTTTAATSNAPAAASHAPPPVKSSLADWAATEDDDWMYASEEKRPRGGRKKKKKSKEAAPVETDWDEIYDPSRPTNVDEYLRSDERIREVQEWKALLYRHRRPAKRQSSWSSSDEGGGNDRPMANQFAPPNSYAFAPPLRSPPRATIQDDKTGDDAYARRLALSQAVAIPPPPSSLSPPPPPPPNPSNGAAAPPPPPPEPDASTISRAPVRYVQPEPSAPVLAAPENDAEPMDVDEPEAAAADADDAPRSNLPGQRGFAARLMSKYGWSKGQGLGADSSGIAQPLRVQVEKRRKRPDSEGGGWAEPGGRGRIIDASRNNGKKGPNDGVAASSSSVGKFGPISPAIVLRRMLDNIEDLQHEVEEGLGQEIGEECGDNYGRVERLYIDVQGHNVYIKFVDQVSALRAVNALDGRVFAGSAIEPQYYDLEAFEKGVYE
ncbi:hypothetical protein PG994_010688 [Apiospora phragmitis]|uniref:G-patch domain-containing protein n=1 Tax=Apiospora phragmitis TaxID=2905665 RepID=A0ABR1TQM9_9PEZI